MRVTDTGLCRNIKRKLQKVAVFARLKPLRAVPCRPHSSPRSFFCAYFSASSSRLASLLMRLSDFLCPLNLRGSAPCSSPPSLLKRRSNVTATHEMTEPKYDFNDSRLEVALQRNRHDLHTMFAERCLYEATPRTGARSDVSCHRFRPGNSSVIRRLNNM